METIKTTLEYKDLLDIRDAIESFRKELSSDSVNLFYENRELSDRFNQRWESLGKTLEKVEAMIEEAWK